MADLGEIEDAVIAAGARAAKVRYLHCVSGYPTPTHEANLRTILDLAGRFDALIGLSDHSLGTEVAVASVALGASVIEKHFTLRRLRRTDAAFPLEPHEFKQLVEQCRSAVGPRLPRVRAQAERGEERRVQTLAYAVADIAAGEPFTDRNVRSIRPGYGLPPKLLPRSSRAAPPQDPPWGTAKSRLARPA
jgi:N-acetylneuraminate synthase